MSQDLGPDGPLQFPFRLPARAHPAVDPEALVRLEAEDGAAHLGVDPAVGLPGEDAGVISGPGQRPLGRLHVGKIVGPAPAHPARQPEHGWGLLGSGEGGGGRL